MRRLAELPPVERRRDRVVAAHERDVSGGRHAGLGPLSARLRGSFVATENLCGASNRRRITFGTAVTMPEALASTDADPLSTTRFRDAAHTKDGAANRSSTARGVEHADHRSVT
jgi:hypothetical protein